MFNPIKHQYSATLMREEGTLAIIKVSNGAYEQEMQIPRVLLPKELQNGGRFNLCIQPEESAKKSQYESMRTLLEDLIR